MTKQNPQQIEASNPESSVWVSASAGTGKTKILTDRVLRLLLAGVEPQRILCLTFTNAASNEMHARINKSLSVWRDNPGDIANLLSRSPNAEELKLAQELYAKLLLTPEQLAIHTIHSFCQKILQRFPFEAGVEPGFKVLSENQTKEICDKLIDDIAHELRGDNARHREELKLRGDPSGGLSDSTNHTFSGLPRHVLWVTSITYLLKNTHQLSFNELILEIINNQIYFRDLHKKYQSHNIYKAYLQKKANIDQDSIIYIQNMLKNLSQMSLPTDLNPKEAKLIEDYNNFLKLPPSDQTKHFAKLKAIFLTLADQPRSTLLYKKSKENHPLLYEKLRVIQNYIVEADEKAKTANMIESTIHVYRLSEYILSKYTDYKQRLVGLDYDDLIYYTKELLSNSDMKDWILYKLDGGIAHLLVDEAQDTSPKQWEIIEAVLKEFYSGESSFKMNRSIFVVGDEKQSIYSFQGADVSNFQKVSEYISKNMKMAELAYKNIELEYAYRSSKPILSFVSETFKDNYMKATNIKCFRDKAKGMVEVWPLYEEEKKKKELFWPSIDEMEVDVTAPQKLAQDIAIFIRQYLDSKMIIPSHGEEVKPGDFMILIRRRNQFTEEIISCLKELSVPVAGIDRMLIMNHLAVKDIISLAKFALLPDDDLNLAGLLKSPIIGMSEGDLLKLSRNRATSLYLSIEDKKLKEVLDYIIELARAKNIYDFLHIIIDILNLREILKQSSGFDSDDVLDELLNLASDWTRSNSSSLQGFIYWLEKREIEIKRDIESKNQVRVMTIHASKGLEAPIVILPDTTSMPSIQNHFLWENGDFLWANSNNSSNKFYSQFKESRHGRDYQEYLRLLYVAMTRAEDHLVIAGYKLGAKNIDNSWYDIADRTMKRMDHDENERGKYFGDLVTKMIHSPPSSGSSLASSSDSSLASSSGSSLASSSGSSLASSSGSDPRIHVNIDPRVKPEDDGGRKRPEDDGGRKNWDNRTTLLTTPLPQIKEDDTEVRYERSPLKERTDISYGIVLHKILEDTVSANNPALANNHSFLKFIPASLQQSIIRKVPKLFKLEEFISILAFPDVRVEASMGYRDDSGNIKFGRMDLLAISDKEVVIIDYKTDKDPPKTPDEVSEKYIAQLQNYVDFIKKTHPNHKISARILWFENLSLMKIL